MYNSDEFQTNRNSIPAEIEAGLTPEERTQADHIREQRMAYEALPNDNQKELKELEVFNAFAAVNKLRVDPGSVTNSKPPKPDIRCTINGEPRYFELGEVTDQPVARCTAEALKRKETLGTFYSHDEPFDYIVQKKGETKYETNGVPVELILYYRTQSPPPPPQFDELSAKYMASLEALVAGGQFQSVWVYDFSKERILWYSAADRNTAERKF